MDMKPNQELRRKLLLHNMTQGPVIGERFRQFRTTIKKSLEQLEEESGFSIDYISCVERGFYVPTVFFFEFFYRRYRLDLTWILTGLGEMFFCHSPRRDDGGDRGTNTAIYQKNKKK